MTLHGRSRITALLLAGVAVVATACTASEQPQAEPLLVLESPGSKSEAVDLVVADLSGRELLRQSTDSPDALPSLHAASGQVAFWRERAEPSGASYELLTWNIPTKALNVITTSPNRPAMQPLWSVDGTEVVTVHTKSPNSFAPGGPLESTAEITVATIATRQSRTLSTERPFAPIFADGKVVAGASFSDDTKYVVADATSGRTLHEFALGPVVGVQPTPHPDVVIAMRETGTPGEVTLHAVNVRTGLELSPLGRVFAGPIPSWPGRNEVIFIAAGDLKAFDYVTSSTRVVGRLEGAGYALSFDPRGTVLLAARVPEQPFYGTFTVANGRLTSAMRPTQASSFGRALGLVRIKV